MLRVAAPLAAVEFLSYHSPTGTHRHTRSTPSTPARQFNQREKQEGSRARAA